MNEFVLRLVKPALCFILIVFTIEMKAQDPSALLKKVKVKMDRVQDYTAKAKMKTDVSFLNVPVADINVYYKNPDRYKIKRSNGISMMPKGGINLNFSALMTPGRFVAVPSGEINVNGKSLKVIKLLPTDDTSNVILTTVYIDEKNLLITRAISTTKENGTFEMDLFYGRFADWGLPDKVNITFSTKDYQLPKGITFEYETRPVKEKQQGDGKGKVEITYQEYFINKGVPDSVF